MAFVIRDDDTCALTPPQYLQDVYDTAWQLGFPVSLSTVPAIVGSYNLNIPPAHRGDQQEYFLTKESPIFSLLAQKKTAGLVDIVQHGYAHTTNMQLRYPQFGDTQGFTRQLLEQSSEFYGLKDQEIITKMRQGKEYLEKLFNAPVTAFVAPQEYLRPVIWQELKNNYQGYSGGIRPTFWEQLPLSAVHPVQLAHLVAGVLTKQSLGLLGEIVVQLTDVPIFPATYRHYWSGFLSDEQAEKTLAQAKQLFAEKYKRPGSYFILLTHYWEYFGDWQDEITQKRQKKYLDIFLNFVNQHDGVWKTSLSELVAAG